MAEEGEWFSRPGGPTESEEEGTTNAMKRLCPACSSHLGVVTRAPRRKGLLCEDYYLPTAFYKGKPTMKEHWI